MIYTENNCHQTNRNQPTLQLNLDKCDLSLQFVTAYKKFILQNRHVEILYKMQKHFNILTVLCFVVSVLPYGRRSLSARAIWHTLQSISFQENHECLATFQAAFLCKQLLFLNKMATSAYQLLSLKSPCINKCYRLNIQTIMDPIPCFKGGCY